MRLATLEEGEKLAALANVNLMSSEAREELRDSSIIHRYVCPEVGRFTQLHALFWHQARIKPRPGGLARGAEIHRGFRGRQVGAIGDLRIFLGLPEDRDVRRVVSHLHSAMIRECGYIATPMGVEADSEDVALGHEVFLLTTEDAHAVAFASVSKQSGDVILACQTDDSGPLKGTCKFGPRTTQFQMIQVEAVWVAPAFRGKGLAADLLRFVAAYHGFHPFQVAYRASFTPGGFAIVRQAVGPYFVVSGEFVTMTLPLDKADDALEPHATFTIDGKSLGLAG